MANPVVGSSSVPPADLLSVLPADRSVAEGYQAPLKRPPSSGGPHTDFSSKLQQYVGGAHDASRPTVDQRPAASGSRAARETKSPMDRASAEGAKGHLKPGQEPPARAVSGRPAKPFSQAPSAQGATSRATPGGANGSAALSKRSPAGAPDAEGASSEPESEPSSEKAEASDVSQGRTAAATDPWMPLSLEKAVAFILPPVLPESPAPEAVAQGGEGHPAQELGTSGLESSGGPATQIRVDSPADLARPEIPNGQMPPSLLEAMRPLPSSIGPAAPPQTSVSGSTPPAQTVSTDPLLSSLSPFQPQNVASMPGVSGATANDSGSMSLTAMGMEQAAAANAQDVLPQGPESDSAGDVPGAEPKGGPPVTGTSTARGDATMRQNSELESDQDALGGLNAFGESMASMETRSLASAGAMHARDIRPALQSRDRGDLETNGVFTTPLESRGSSAPVFDADNLVLVPGAMQPAAAVKQEILSKVMEIRSQGPGSMNVVLKPDPNTQLSVQLRNHAGGVQVMVTVERGDASHLRGAWEGLQHAFAQQGVQLSDLEVNRAAIRESVLRAASEASPALDRLTAQDSAQTGFAGSDAESNSGRHGRAMNWMPQDNPGASTWLDRRPSRSPSAGIPDAAASSSASPGANRLARGEAGDSAASSHRPQNHLETWA